MEKESFYSYMEKLEELEAEILTLTLEAEELIEEIKSMNLSKEQKEILEEKEYSL